MVSTGGRGTALEASHEPPPVPLVSGMCFRTSAASHDARSLSVFIAQNHVAGGVEKCFPMRRHFEQWSHCTQVTVCSLLFFEALGFGGSARVR